MCSVNVIVLLFVTELIHADVLLVGNRTSDEQDITDNLVDQLIDKLVCQVFPRWPFHHADLERTALAKTPSLKYSKSSISCRSTPDLSAGKIQTASKSPSSGWSSQYFAPNVGRTGKTECRDLRNWALGDSDTAVLGEALRGVLEPKWNESKAVDLARTFAARGALKAFGRGRRVPKRPYTLEELRLNKVNAEALLSPEDTQVVPAERALQAGLLAAWIAASVQSGAPLIFPVALLAFLATTDQIAYGGGLWFLAVDTIARLPIPILPGPRYARRVALHEAGHFLVAYLLGILPSGYTLSAFDATRRYRALSVQAGCTFCDSDFQREVALNRLSSGSLDVYSCMALAGVAVEFVEFGRAEGGRQDIAQLDGLLSALQFNQKQASNQVRWAALNTVQMLRTHIQALRALADAMQAGKPVEQLIAVVESCIDEKELATLDRIVAQGSDDASRPRAP